MADVEEPALAKAAAELAGAGASVLPVVTDVSDRAAVDALRDAALSAFGAVHVVCNNAGVGGPHGPLWECPPGEWDWVLGVNLEGVMNGVRTFMPRAARAGRRAPGEHIVDLRRVRGDPRAVRRVQARGRRADRDAALQPEVPRRHARRRLRALPWRGADELRHLRRGTARRRPGLPPPGTRPSRPPPNGSISFRCSAPRPRTSRGWWWTGSGRAGSTS